MEFKSIRLSSTKREEIVNSILEKWDTTNPRKCNKKLQNSIAEYYYNKAYKNILTDLTNPLLKEFFEHSSSVKVQEKGIVNQYLFIKEKPYPKGNSYYNNTIIYVSDTEHKLKQEMNANDVYNDNLLQERNTFQSQLFQTLNSVNTTGQLREIWPQVIDYLPSYMVDPGSSINLPAISISTLNAKLVS